MLATITPVAAAIKHLTSTGATERQRLAAVAQRSAEPSIALQEATIAAERHALAAARRY